MTQGGEGRPADGSCGEVDFGSKGTGGWNEPQPLSGVLEGLRASGSGLLSLALSVFCFTKSCFLLCWLVYSGSTAGEKGLRGGCGWIWRCRDWGSCWRESLHKGQRWPKGFWGKFCSINEMQPSHRSLTKLLANLPSFITAFLFVALRECQCWGRSWKGEFFIRLFRSDMGYL